MSDKMELVTTGLVGLVRQKPNPRLGQVYLTQNHSPYAGGFGQKGVRCYETDEARELRIKNLIALSGTEFAAKLALSLRIQHGQRSMAHLISGIIASQCAGEDWAEDFFYQVFRRADDPCETVGAYQKHGRKGKLDKHGRLPLPAALKRAIASFFDRMDSYKLAKYANRQGWPRLVDLANITCPKLTNKEAKKAMKALIEGTLKNEDTWEARLSAAGQSKGEVSKQKVWQELIENQELGQLALLRNLRNIATECNEATIKEACKQLVNRDAIKKNGILPMQYLKAYEVIGQMWSNPHVARIRAAIDDAVEIAAGNVPSLGDNVLVAIDESGSMEQIERDNAALFGAVLLKSNPNADLMYFATDAKYVPFNRKLPIMELMAAIKAGFGTGATNFNRIFQSANKAYDSIVILSDQEGWMGSGHGGQEMAEFLRRTQGGVPTASMNEYKNKFGCNPTIFTFDLGGDGSLMFREDGIIALAGFSFGVFKLLNILRQDRVKLTDVIDKIVIGQPLPILGEEDEE
jgi:60 kDa SS-A/Ro ribonucleoprotein